MSSVKVFFVTLLKTSRIKRFAPSWTSKEVESRVVPWGAAEDANYGPTSSQSWSSHYALWASFFIDKKWRIATFVKEGAVMKRNPGSEG